MNNPKVLYISGSLGLGHITRDLSIANELRRKIPGIDIKWLAVHPASLVLKEAGETLVPEASRYSNENEFAEQSSNGAELNLLKYLLKAKNAWKNNVEVFSEIVNKHDYDLVIGDETYEISLALREQKELKKFPFVMIYDFVGLDAMTKNPMEKFGVYIWNLKWTHDYRKKIEPAYDLGLFIGLPEDIPDKPFGFMLPNRRKYAEEIYKFPGYILPFNPEKLINNPDLRKNLGYNSEPVIIVSVGGTSIGKELLELCGKAFALLKEKKPSVRMILVAGPRIQLNEITFPEGVEVRKYVPKLYEHFAVCNLAIVQGGATSVLELTALKTPFIFFPLEEHFEQANVARILRKRGIGLEMKFSQTSPEILADKISRLLHTKVQYPDIPTDGAKKAAYLISDLLKPEEKLVNHNSFN
jgi:UDP:flavonoid glycosyltransferase YjiC (YdhE family)